MNHPVEFLKWVNKFAFFFFFLIVDPLKTCGGSQARDQTQATTAATRITAETTPHP